MLSKSRFENLFLGHKNRSFIIVLSKSKRLKEWEEQRKEKLFNIHDSNRPGIDEPIVVNFFDEDGNFEAIYIDGHILNHNPIPIRPVVGEEPDTEVRNIIRYRNGRYMKKEDFKAILNFIATGFDSIRDQYNGLPNQSIPRYIYAIPTQGAIKYKCPDGVSNDFMVNILSNYDEDLEIAPAN